MVLLGLGVRLEIDILGMVVALCSVFTLAIFFIATFVGHVPFVMNKYSAMKWRRAK